MMPQITATSTPGPWITKPAINQPDPKIGILASGGVIAEVFEHGGSSYDIISPVAANAQLIAAAPDLLEELKSIVDGWRQMEATVRNLTPWEAERWKFARDAIAKAEL